MSSRIDREMLTQVVFVVGACLGAFVLFVAPKMEELSKIEAAIAESRVQTAAIDDTAVERLADRVPEIHDRINQISDRSRLAMDSAGLFARIMELARFNEVEVKNLQPRVQESTGGDEERQLTRIDITVEGDYHRVAAFAESLNTVGAYLRTQSLQIMPTVSDNGRPATMLQIGCEALSFRVPEELLQLQEVDLP